ncbi:ISL3 family transposase [Lactobacillus sp. CBA3605]|uniref:ISL3 family transposase n=1 Tax=Lactobacillus sp. CBA3605 TaxID=2099788 RepID=UPI000CFE1D5B|nr:ISL3 family transposase [Lactobacillus sp. CBA3605]AVK62550.1 ISL3 family transposase [Lactobacillus sp. CBA3605]AVK62551.1 ISL3 family transposase [Lactobacillus sp. CBA3605]
MSQDQSTRILLQIKDQNITNFKIQDNSRDALRIYADLSYSISVCPRCGQHEIVRNGFKTVNIRISNISERTALLILRKQRFLCRACGHSLLAQTPVVAKQHQISQHVKHRITTALTEDRTMVNIAAEYNVSTNTVSRQLVALGKQTRPAYDGLPTTLCIDEFRSTGKQMSFIAIDAQKHDLIAILPGRRTKEIKAFFLNHYSLKNRQQVTQVVMDFNANYYTIMHSIFPNAKVVADNFHLVQMVLRSLNQTRVQLMKRFAPDTREYRVLKYYWRLYLKDYSKLEKDKPQWFSHLKDHLTQEQLILEGLDLNEEFANTYYSAHELVEAIRSRNYVAFIEALGRVENVSPQLLQTIKTFIKNKQFIKNMTECSLSNGPIEGVNRKIKQIKRTAYGYRNWMNFNYRIQIEFKIKIKKRSPIRK